ncbi:50S ribosomal protein L23 [Candidatus Blochmanniella vafra str. BVAF]|uniref:Large ribosomal subunit protein uL23 n=1 Tax=Blochmanniella vafra (strain BVAF) TaxID=859654 RepID=E8Q5X9_BLOVB|nr:50S ribosomal protein L23 [Candidatus Blochmannia vafer]ADV33595.1 50S ribosomal protein L23 [Candidatus Blochmannia vafer str. BVAF]
MIYIERLLKVIKVPHISEKASIVLEKNNVVILKVSKNSTKMDIQDAVCMLFSVTVKKINILMVAGKTKGSKGNIGRRCDWKKAYVILNSGCKIDLFDKIR